MLVAQETSSSQYVYKYGIFSHSFRKNEATKLNPERLSLIWIRGNSLLIFRLFRDLSFPSENIHEIKADKNSNQ